jgi:hypothetical protein
LKNGFLLSPLIQPNSTLEEKNDKIQRFEEFKLLILNEGAIFQENLKKQKTNIFFSQSDSSIEEFGNQNLKKRSNIETTG